MRKICLFIIAFSFVCISAANAQYASQKNAANLIILKVMADYKMNDAEYINDIEALRENERFNKKLQKMLEATSNARSKDAKSERIDRILRKAGEDIDNVLNIR
ncbi:MAG: hypothetical protein LBR70_01780 [Lactobacillaceae bacterium]|jgi:hypothetical protein|nr:hypothetical protein [Lactobacillaceae bacterium]